MRRSPRSGFGRRPSGSATSFAPCERAEPVERRAEPHHLAEHDDRRRLQAARAQDRPAASPSVVSSTCCASVVALRHDRHRLVHRGGRPWMSAAAICAEMLHRHIHDDDRRAARHALPVDRGRREAALVVAGQERHGLVDVAVRDRNAGIGEPADARRDARARRGTGCPPPPAPAPPRRRARRRTGRRPSAGRRAFRPARSAISFSEMSRCFGDGLPPRLPAYSIERAGPRMREHALVDQRVIDDARPPARAR